MRGGLNRGHLKIPMNFVGPPSELCLLGASIFARLNSPAQKPIGRVQ